MIFNIIAFELKYWKTRIITYVFPLIVFLISLLAFTVDNISLGSEVAYRNAPATLLMVYFIFFLMLPIFVNSFVSSSITRDYEFKVDQIIYSLPISRFNLLLGRFIGGCLVVSWMFIGVLIADIIAKYMPWVEPGMLTHTNFVAHLMNYFLIALPNIFIIGSILFLIASWTKNNNFSFLGAIVMVVLYLTLISLMQKIDNKIILSLSDPFGFIPIEIQTKKWTAFERNHSLFQLDFRFLLNRLVWFIVAAFLWFIAFSIVNKKGTNSKSKKEQKVKKVESFIPKVIQITTDFSWKYTLKNIFFQAKIDALNLIKSPAFYVIVGLIFMVYSLILVGMVQDDRTNEIATSYNTIRFLGGVKTLMKFAIIFFSGILIWKERDAKMNDILDALPSNPFLIYLGKLLSIFYVSIALNIIVMIIGILYQVFQGVFNIEFGLYFTELFIFDVYQNMTLAILAMFLQIIINNKYIAYFVSLLIMFLESFLKSWLEIDSNMVGISPNLPSVIYSDIYGYGPYLKNQLAFMVYWALFYGTLLFASMYFMVRGKSESFSKRLNEAKTRFLMSRWQFSGVLICFIVFGAWIYYQTKIKNQYMSQTELMDRKAYYEKNFKKYDNINLPKVVKLVNAIDLFPEERKVSVKGTFTMVNTSDTIIDKVYVNNSLKFPYKLNFSAAKKIASNTNSHVLFETYQFNKPLSKGDTIYIDYEREVSYSGIENEVEDNRLLPNGTFLDVSELTPLFGYQPEQELDDKSEREERGLGVKSEDMPKLEENCTHACQKDYLGGYSDWAQIYTTVSTSKEQTAIAPGSLKKHWNQNGRNYFEYHLEQPSKFFFSVVSAKFNVLRDSTNGVLCEVYYHPAHNYNVKEMMKALKKSIQYYSSNFGPYYHKEARIIEFPQFSSFAQAFPGTMPFSESVGFTSNLVDNPKDINEIFHIVSHEMAHQWWAHQVIGANMQGATFLSESLAEYASLKLLQLEYGIDMTAKFLKDANNNYIFSRAGEAKKESSLLQVDNKPYIHYQKGSIVLFGIQQIIGEKAINTILNDIVKNFAYKNPPYPTSYQLYNRLYQATPDSFKYLVKDGIENIIIYQSDIEKIESVKSGKGYKTTVTFSLKKNSSDPNAKQTKDLDKIMIGQSKEIPFNDYFDIALFQEESSKTRYGKLIVSQRFKLIKSQNTLSIYSDKKPDKLVIDPYFIYIHKDPEENIKNI